MGAFLISICLLSFLIISLLLDTVGFYVDYFSAAIPECSKGTVGCNAETCISAVEQTKMKLELEGKLIPKGPVCVAVALE